MTRFTSLTAALLPAIISGVLYGSNWTPDNHFEGWKAGRNVVCTVTDTALKLSEIKADPQLIQSGLQLDPKKFNTFSFRYRASGISPTDGQLYYQHEFDTFADRRKWRLPALLADGQWHTVTVRADRLVNPDSWFNSGMITRLRFDPTDGAGGEIEISEIRFTQEAAPAAETAAPAAPVALPVNSELTEWNAANRFYGWRAQRNVKCSITADAIQLTAIEKDPQIINRSVRLDPAKCNTFTYTYRADGTAGARGQLYFAKEKQPISDHSYWRLPVPVADGQWHTVTLTSSALCDAKLWFDGGAVTMLRFDPTDGAGGTFEIREMKFTFQEIARPLPPVKARLDASPWPALTPQYFDPPKHVQEPYFQGLMVASRLDQAEPGGKHDFFLRREFQLKSKPSSAWLQFSADDAARAFLNGREVAQNGNWTRTSVENVTDCLTAGKNVLGFAYRNTAGAGGVFGELYVEYPDGTFERISTDEQFRSTTAAAPDWAAPGGDAAAWSPVTAKPGPPNLPWKTVLEYRDFSKRQKLCSAAMVPCQAQAGQPVRLSFEFEGPVPSMPILAVIKLERGTHLLWSENLTLNADAVHAIDARRWKMEFDYTMPVYLSSAKQVKFRLATGSFVCMEGGFPEVTFDFEQAARIPGYEQEPRFTVRTLPGYGPAFVLNDRPFYPLWGGVASHYQSIAESGRISGAPFNVVTVHNRSQTWWPSGDVFDPSVFDQVAELYRRTNPDAYFIWDLTFRMPHDWAARYPDEMCRDDHGEVVRDSVAFSFSSQQARRDMEAMLDKALAYLEKSPYRNRIVAYRINAGHTIEWLGWSPQSGRSVDFSLPSQRGFEEFARRNYPELNDFRIPTYAERAALDDGELLWNPARHLRETAYMDYLSNSVVDFLIAMNSRAKAFLRGRKAVGSYYAYDMTLNSNGNSQHRAHFAARKLLESGAVDFLMSPQAYNIRKNGDAYGDMKPFASLNFHNIVAILEDDTRTHRAPGGRGFYQTMNEADTLNIMRRNMGFSLCRQQPGYYYALAGTRMLDIPALDRDLALFRKTGEFCLVKPVGRRAEIAIVVSEEAVKGTPILSDVATTGELDQAYKPDGTVRTFSDSGVVLASEIHGKIFNRFARVGAPVDYLLAEDLKTNPGNYKLYVFVNAFQYDDELLAAVEKLRQRPDAMLCWLYAPGRTYRQNANVENMRKLTGLTLRRVKGSLLPAVKLTDGRWMGTTGIRVAPLFAIDNTDAEVLGRYENGDVGLAVLKNAPCTTVFFGGWQFDMEFLLALVKRAQIYTYSDATDPMEANDALVALHARFEGTKTIRLPRKTDVLDVFNRKIVARKVDQFTFDAPLHSSHLFYYGNDAETLLEKLESISE